MITLTLSLNHYDIFLTSLDQSSSLLLKTVGFYEKFSLRESFRKDYTKNRKAGQVLFLIQIFLLE
jgi:hypothetical protein